MPLVTPNFYVIEDRNYDRVTRVIGNLPVQDVLVPWSARMAIEAAGEIPQADYQSISAWTTDVKALSEAKRVEKREFGTEVHAAIEAKNKGLEVLDRFQPWVLQAEMAQKRLIKHKAYHEVVIYNEEMGYAGTVDVWSKDNLVDWKTGRIYGAAAIQLWAYMNATHMIHDGDKIKEIKDPPTFGHAVHLEAFESEVYTIERDSDRWQLLADTFEHLRGIHEYQALEQRIW